MLGMFLAALDQTIVATSIRTIGDDLHGLSLQAWVTTAYLLTATISTPLYGKLSDIYGRKPLYLISISIFVRRARCCPAPPTRCTSWRSTAASRASAPVASWRWRSRSSATWSPPASAPATRATSSPCSASSSRARARGRRVLRGRGDDPRASTGWRWVFLINVPIGILAIIVISRVLHLPPLRRVDHKIDYPGALALIVALVPLLVVAEQGRIWGWDSPRSIACYVVGVLGVAAFILAERYAKADAILPLYLFRNRTFSVGAGANTVIGLGMFGGLATLPLYLQIVKGQTPTEAGLTLIPFTLGIMAGSIVAGQTTSRTGRYKVFPVIGTVLMGLGALLFSRLESGTTLPLRLRRARSCSGSGLGLHDAAARAGRAERRAGAGHGRRDVVVAVLPADGRHAGDRRVPVGAVLDGRRQHRGRLPDRGRRRPRSRRRVADPAVMADPANAPVLAMLQPAAAATVPSLDDSSFINNLDPRLAQPFLDGFAQSVDTVLLLAAFIMAVGVILTVMLPELPLRNVSGIQGRFDDDAAAAAARRPRRLPRRPPWAGSPRSSPTRRDRASARRPERRPRSTTGVGRPLTSP